MKRFAVVISGCGHKDGAEITETISTLITLSESQVDYQIFAPDIEVPTINHLTGETSGNHHILAEAARIGRGQVRHLDQLEADEFDGIIFPGGYGAALHLCDFAKKGAHGSVLPKVKSAIEDFHSQGKPIGAICIAPALVAKVLGTKGVTVTIGNDAETAKEIEKTGAHHVNCAVDDYVTDREMKVVTTPAYMYDAKPYQVFTGIRKAIRELIEMA